MSGRGKVPRSSGEWLSPPRSTMSSAPLASFLKGMRRTRRTWYETRRDTEPKPERGLVTPERSSRRGRGRMRVGKDKRAHASRLHRGIKWLGSSRDLRGGSSLLPPIPEERSGICKIPRLSPVILRSINVLYVSRFPRIRNLITVATIGMLTKS